MLTVQPAPEPGRSYIRWQSKMSYINEALKKAQRDKDGGRKDYIHTIGRTAGLERSFRKKPVYIISIIILLALILIYSKSGRQAEQVTDTAGKLTGGIQVIADDDKHILLTDTDKQQAEDHASLNNSREEEIISNREALYSQASYYLKDGKLKQAEGILKKILSQDPGHINSLNDMGVLSLNEDRYEDAISFFEKAVRLKPKFANPYYNLACAYSLKNDVDKGMVYLLKAIEIDEKVKDWANEDPDLQNLKEYAEFTAITE